MKVSVARLRRIVREAVSGHLEALNGAEMAMAALTRLTNALKQGNGIAAQGALRQASFYLKSVQSELNEGTL